MILIDIADDTRQISRHETSIVGLHSDRLDKAGPLFSLQKYVALARFPLPMYSDKPKCAAQFTEIISFEIDNIGTNGGHRKSPL